MAIENIEIGTVTNDGKGERLALAFDVANANFNELETGKENPLTFSSPLVRTVNAVSIPKASSGINGYLSGSDWNTFINKQSAITLTTTGTSGASTLVGSALNIPQYSGGLQGVHSLLPIISNEVTSFTITSASLISAVSNLDRLTATLYYPAQNITTLNLFINITTLAAGALGRISIYSDNNGIPQNLLYTSSDLNLSTTGKKTATVTFNFVSGTKYWMVVHTNSNTVAFTTVQTLGLLPLKSLASNGSVVCTYTANSTFSSGTPAVFPAGIWNLVPMPFIGITKA